MICIGFFVTLFGTSHKMVVALSANSEKGVLNVGNNYMNHSQRACGGPRYMPRMNRYPGCYANRVCEPPAVCESAPVTPVCPREPGCDCECECKSPTERVIPCPGQTVTMAYVPVQEWGDLYEVDRAYCRGTLFRDLDKPFTGGRGV